MKKLASKTPILSILMVLFLLSCTSCSKKIAFLTSPVVPAARGDVQVKKDNNKNYVIHVNIMDLAEVERLSPPKKTYVVWMVSEQEIAKNIGQINSKMSMAKNLKASFQTVSATKPNKIFLTAEDDPKVSSPAGQTVLSTDSF